MGSFNRLVSAVVVCACFTGILSGCAKAPEQELAAARAALNAAQSAEADKYMPNNFTNIGKALKAAEEEIVLQNSVFAVTRNYKKAKLLLGNATMLATQLLDEIPKIKADTKTEVEQGLVTAQKMVIETRTDIKKAPSSIDKKVRTQMAADLKSSESALAEASSLFEAGKILDARKKLVDAQSLLKGIFNKLSTGGGMSLM